MKTTSKIIIGVVLVALVIGIFWYYQNQKKKVATATTKSPDVHSPAPPISTEVVATGRKIGLQQSEIPVKYQFTGELGYTPVAPANAQVGQSCGQGYGTWQHDGTGGMYCMSNAYKPKAVS